MDQNASDEELNRKLGIELRNLFNELALLAELLNDLQARVDWVRDGDTKKQALDIVSRVLMKH